MKKDTIQEILSSYLIGGQSYALLEDAVNNINPEIINKKISENSNTVWQLLEHIRISQEDIFRYTLEPNWVSPSWPEGHWPDKNEIATKEMLDNSVEQLLSDFEKVKMLAADNSIDFTTRIPHGEWRTYLRQIILIIEHNAYHLGQLILLRKYFGNWK